MASDIRECFGKNMHIIYPKFALALPYLINGMFVGVTKESPLFPCPFLDPRLQVVPLLFAPSRA